MIHGKHTVNFGFEFYNYRTNILYVGNSGLAGEFTTTAPSQVIPRVPPEHRRPAGRKPTSCSVFPRTSAWARAAVAVCTTACIPRSCRTIGTIMPNLTLNLGLRYEVVTPRGVKHIIRLPTTTSRPAQSRLRAWTAIPARFTTNTTARPTSSPASDSPISRK